MWPFQYRHTLTGYSSLITTHNYKELTIITIHVDKVLRIDFSNICKDINNFNKSGNVLNTFHLPKPLLSSLIMKN